MSITINIFSIKDTKANFFRSIFQAQHTAEAVRAFQNTVNHADPHNDISQYPKEFDLYHLGSLDQNTGKLIPLESGPDFVVGGVSLVRWAERTQDPNERKYNVEKGEQRLTRSPDGRPGDFPNG